MNRVLLVGAGGFGREFRTWLEADGCLGAGCELVGFLDDAPQPLSEGYDLPVMGSIRDYIPTAGDRLVMAIGAPRVKLQIAELLLSRGATFMTLIHPTAIIGRGVTIGTGCILCPQSVVTCDATIGDFAFLNIGASVGHDAVVGPGCTLSPHADVTGHARLGRGVFLGTHAAVLPGVEVGDYATVGAGSIVLRRVRPGTTVMGVPAKRV